MAPNCVIILVRGISAVGSAPHWQCGGHGFKSRMLHFCKAEPCEVCLSGGYMKLSEPNEHGS